MRSNTLTDRVTVARTGSIADSHKTGRTNVATGVPCLILASSATAAAQRGLELSQAYDLFCDTSAGIQASDKVTDQNGRVFDISGVRTQPGIRTSHLQCLANLKV
jgi:hypothetical protein